MPLILGAQSAVATGYSIDNSLRFNNPDSPSMAYTIGSDGSLVANTINVWVKLDSVGAASPILFQYVSGTIAKLYVGGTASVSYQIQYYSNRTGESPAEPDRITTADYTDPSAWYNIHAVWDSDNGVAADRMRIYVNGTRVTDFTTEVNPESGSEFGMFNYTDGARTLNIATKPYGSSAYFGGYMANLIVCDGQTYEPSKFGEFNEDSPTIWQPLDPADQSLTFGTHGFWLDFADSADLGNDVSGNGNDFTPTNLAAVDQCTDSPTNNFCTLNPLWYADLDDNYPNYVVTNTGSTTWTVYNNPTSGGNSSTFTDTAVAADDIIGVAYDADNGALYVALNNDWMNSGDPTSGASATGAIVSSITVRNGGIIMPVQGCATAASRTFSYNFGNPSYANSSDAADANGYGKFEFSPPSGYLALCTKNLGSDGG